MGSLVGNLHVVKGSIRMKVAIQGLLLAVCVHSVCCGVFGDFGKDVRSRLENKLASIGNRFSGKFDFKKKEEEQCSVIWENHKQPHCSTDYDKECTTTSEKQCKTEYSQECSRTYEDQCTTVQDKECWDEPTQECKTEYDEECWTED